MKKAFSVFTTTIMVIAIIFAVLLVGVRIAGISPYVVISGSMEPAFHVGSVVYVKKADPKTLEVGDPITFDIGGDELVTHRIVSIEDDNGQMSFVTKGDANEMADLNPVMEDQVKGKVIFTIPGLGKFEEFIKTTMGRIIAICIAGALIVLVALQEYLKKTDM